MKVLYCDVCKKPIQKPIHLRNYFHIADIDICEPCKEDLDLALRQTQRGKSPFTFDWNDELTLRILHAGMERGKIEVKTHSFY